MSDENQNDLLEDTVLQTQWEELKKQHSTYLNQLSQALNYKDEMQTQSEPTRGPLSKVTDDLQKDIDENKITKEEAIKVLSATNDLLRRIVAGMQPLNNEAQIDDEEFFNLDNLINANNKLPADSNSFFTLKNATKAAIVLGLVVGVAALTLFALSTMGIGPGVIGAGLLIAHTFGAGGALAGAMPSAAAFFQASMATTINSLAVLGTSSFWSTIGTGITHNMPALLNAITTTFTPVGNAIASSASTAGPAIATAFSSAAQSIAELPLFIQIPAAISTAIATGAAVVYRKEIGETVSQTFQSMKETLRQGRAEQSSPSPLASDSTDELGSNNSPNI